MQTRPLVRAAWSMVLAGGLACSGGGRSTNGTAGAPGGQAGVGGTAGAAGGSSTAGSGGASSAAGVSGGAGDGSLQGGAGTSPQGTGGGGGGGGAAGSSGAGGAGQDGGAGTSASIDAAIVDGGARGVTAPGLGQDTPSPPTPTLGTYNGSAARAIMFSAASLDPMANSGHQTDNQVGRFDSSKPTKWKLIVLLPGIGNGPGLGTSSWIATQGYHEFDVAYDNDIPGAPNSPDPRASDPATVGNTRMNQFDAAGRTPACSDDNCTMNAPTITRSNSIEQRVINGLNHLAQVDPMGGWDWYLNADGTIRWSDAGFFGYSYGATHAAVISVYVRLGLIVVGSGPWNESHPEATWIKTASATPGLRAYAIYGKQDGRYMDYENETKELGWPGPYPFELPTLTTGVLTEPAPWYMGSHSLLVDDQGHTEFCAGSNSVCLYSFDHDGQ